MKSLFESTLVVNPLGKQGSEYVIEINGKKYGYSCSDEIYRKFLKIMQFSAGRALAWFKKNTTIERPNDRFGFKIIDMGESCPYR